MLIRLARHTDRKRLSELTASWPGTSLCDSFLEHPHFCILVAVAANGAIVGYAAGHDTDPAQVRESLGTASGVYGQHRVALLDEIMVRPSHERRGIGALLVRSFEDWARQRGCSLATLGGPRPGFYKKLGYERVGDLGFWKVL